PAGPAFSLHLQETSAPIDFAFSASIVRRTHACRPVLPIAHPDVAAFLGGSGLRRAPAVRRRGGGRDLPSGDHLARARARALARRLCPAFAAADRRPLRREPEPASALLPVPGDSEAGPREQPGALPRKP